MTDEELALAAKSGNAQAMAELWTRMRKLSLAAAGRYGFFAARDSAIDREDLNQAAALAFLEYVGRYDPAMSCSFTTGLFQFIGWRILRTFDPRRDRTEELPAIVSLDAPLADEDDLTLADLLEDERAREPFERIEPAADLARAVEKLPEEQQRVLRLRYRDERPWQAVGAALGIGTAQARVMGQKAAAALRRDRSLWAYRPIEWRHVTLAEYRLTGVSAVEDAVERRERCGSL